MPATLHIRDETTTGRRTNAFELDVIGERVTLRDLIVQRVCQEVEAYNRSRPEVFRGLVQPAGADRVPDGYRVDDGRALDAEAQSLLALDGFQRNGFFVIVDDRQVESLDDEIALRSGAEVAFVKLTPLVGG